MIFVLFLLVWYAGTKCYCWYHSWEWVSEWVSELLLFNAKWAALQFYLRETSYIRWHDDGVCFVRLGWIVFYSSHWNNSTRIDMSLQTDTLFWFRANKSMLFLLITAWLEKNIKIQLYNLMFDPIGARIHDLSHSMS